MPLIWFETHHPTLPHIHPRPSPSEDGKFFCPLALLFWWVIIQAPSHMYFVYSGEIGSAYQGPSRMVLPHQAGGWGSQKLWFCPIAACGCLVPLGDYSGRYLWGYCIIPTTSHSFFSPQMIRMKLDENSTSWLIVVSSCFGVVTHRFTDDYLQYLRFFIPIGANLLSISMHQDSG